MLEYELDIVQRLIDSGYHVKYVTCDGDRTLCSANNPNIESKQNFEGLKCLACNLGSQKDLIGSKQIHDNLLLNPSLLRCVQRLYLTLPLFKTIAKSFLKYLITYL